MKNNGKETLIGIGIIIIGIISIFLFYNSESKFINTLQTLLIFFKDWIYKIIVLIMLFKINNKLKKKNQ